jgi:hypothetical protein
MALSLTAGDEILGHAEFDIGLEQGDADVPQGIDHVGLGNLAKAAQLLDRPFQAVTQLIKHVPSCRRDRSHASGGRSAAAT